MTSQVRFRFINVDSTARIVTRSHTAVNKLSSKNVECLDVSSCGAFYKAQGMLSSKEVDL